MACTGAHAWHAPCCPHGTRMRHDQPGPWSTYLEQIVTGHSGLAGHASGDDDNISAPNGLGQLVLVIALHRRPSSPVRIDSCLSTGQERTPGIVLLRCYRPHLELRTPAQRCSYLDGSLGVAVRHISSNARGAGNIVEAQLGDLAVQLRTSKVPADITISQSAVFCCLA
jgi:hypothetical protein